MVLNNFRFYPTQIELDPACGRYSVIVRGIPGGSDGDTLEEAQANAKQLIFDCAGFYFDSGREYNGAGKAEAGDQIIDVGSENALKLMLRCVMTSKKTTQTQLAAALQVKPATMCSYMSLKKSTRLETLCKCFDILGAPLQISC